MIDELPLEHVNNVWQLLGLLGSVGIIVSGMWWTQRQKRDGDRKAEAAAPVLEAAQEAVDLRPAVDALSAQVTELRDELETMTPIVRVKYPLALDHITTLHTAEPKLTAKYPIPRTLREDMAE